MPHSLPISLPDLINPILRAEQHQSRTVLTTLPVFC